MTGKCYYCEREFSDPKTTTSNLVIKTRDHIIPVSRGGNNSAKNRVFACQKCNSAKGNMMPEEFCIILRDTPNQAGIKKQYIDTVLKNAEALVLEIAPYRDELLKPSTKPKPRIGKGFDPAWSTFDKDTIILKAELEKNTRKVIAQAEKKQPPHRDAEFWDT